MRAFFDKQTGLLESMPRDAEVEGVFDDITGAPERWVEIRPLPASDRLDLRRSFVNEQVDDAYLRLQLFEALDGQRAFARFDALLRTHPELLDRFFEYRASRLELLARTWLGALGIEAGARSGPVS